MTDELPDDRSSEPEDETDESSGGTPAFDPDAAGNDNIREGRVGGLMGSPRGTQGGPPGA